MKKQIYKLQPELGLMIVFLTFFLPIGGTFLWFFSPILTFLFVIATSAFFYFGLKKRGSLFFYDEYIIVKTSYGKKEQRISYDDLSFVQYHFARGSSTLTVFFKSKILNVNSLVYSSKEIASKRKIIAFLRSKDVAFKTIPRYRISEFDVG